MNGFPQSIIWCKHVIQFLIPRDFVSWPFPVSTVSSLTCDWCLSRYSLESLSVGAQGGQHAWEITAYEGNPSHQRSGMKKWRQGVSLQDTPMPRCAARAALTFPSDSSHSRTQQLLELEPPSDPHLPPKVWDGHIKIPFWERGGRAEHQRTPLSSMSRVRWQSSYEITLYSCLKGGCSEVGSVSSPK